MLVFTDRGWELEREQRAEEFLHEWNTWIDNDVDVVSMEYLKGRNRGMILLLLQKIEKPGDPKCIPLLEKWERIDYKKVRQEIRRVISHLELHAHRVKH